MHNKLILSVLVAIACLLASARAEATHFRYGNISYTRPDPIGSPRTVRFEVVTAWRSAFVGTSTLHFGDATSNPDTQGVEIGSGVDASGLEYKFQKYIVTHTYPNVAQTQYVAYFTSCCRLSNLINAGDDDFRVEAKVDLSPGRKGNPTTFVPAINQFQIGGMRSMFIPAVDPDGQPVSCRFSTFAESQITTNPPIVPGTAKIPTIAPSVSPPGCVLTWDTTGAPAGQQYAVSVALETPGATEKATLDYIIEFVTAPPPTCAGSGSFIVPIGTQFSHQVTGTTVGAPSLKMTAIWQTGAITPVPPATAPSPFNTTLAWTPSLGEEGTYVATIIYTNTVNSSGFCSLALTVPQCVGYGSACSVGVGACQTQGTIDCNGGSPACNAVAGAPSPELCDGIDNDCNDATDEGNPQAGQPCSSGLAGACSPGATDCSGGSLACNSFVAPGELGETCDGTDEDCDGSIDEDFSVGAPCASGVGACAVAGVVVCDGPAASICNAVPGSPSAEICNALDEDCDGTADDGFGLGTACTSGLGVCAAGGVLVCDGQGGAACNGVPGTPAPEVCDDGLDDDCDGAPDDGCGDGDGDGLADETEQSLGSDPSDADSDDDGVIDGDEPGYAEDDDGDLLPNVLDADSDDDGLFDGTELGLGCDDPDTDAAAGHCVADVDPATETDPRLEDSDGGGASDGSEDPDLDGAAGASEGDPLDGSDDDAVADADQDGLGDALEATLGSRPNDGDSDDDGLLDGDEANPSADADHDGLRDVVDVDSDDDALPDGLELGRGCSVPSTDAAAGHCRADVFPATKTSPVAADTDRGGAMDGSEDADRDGAVDASEADPSAGDDDTDVADTDGDGLGDALELALGADVGDADTDDDGLLDGDEPNPADDRDGDDSVDLLDPDSDGDGLFDGTEAGRSCSDPATAEAPGTCIADGDAGATTTWVLLADSDEGGALDGDEDTDHDGVVEPGERDPRNPADDDSPAECLEDGDCGGATSGRVCDVAAFACVDGCRATGNGCPPGQSCSSAGDDVGVCEDATTSTGGEEPPPPPQPEGDDSGCGCTVPASGGQPIAAYLVALGALALARRRRR